jgi:hypothetical protein
MAANINNSAQRFDYARAERNDESNNNSDAATSDGQSAQSTETTLAAPTEQQGQSGDSGSNNAGTHDPSTPPLLSEEAEAPIPFPAQFRYGLGEISIGRPAYTRIAIEQTDRASSDSGAINPRPTALALTPRAENAPSPALPAANAAKPIALPKPGSTNAPDTPASPPPPASSAWPAVPTPIINHAPLINGEAVDAQAPSNRTPYLYAGLNTAPEQSPHYTNALAYGHEHGYKDDEIMKLAVLMQANRDQNMGREWLSLKPAVLRAAVNAVVRNADNSFDTSGVFGGQLGYPRVNAQRIPADASTAAYQFSGDGAPQYASAPPEGWVLIEREVVTPGSSGDSGEGSTTTTLRYYIPKDEINVTDEIVYLPLAVAGYMQVPRGMESELSVGADGGVNDLGALDFDPEYGLVTRTDNYRPYSADGNDWDRFMEIVTIGTISIGAMAAIGPVVSAGMGSSTAGVVAAGAANGVIGSAITTMLQGGEVTFRGLLQAALSGGMLAGLNTLESYQGLRSMGLDRAGNVTSYALRAMSITGTSTIRGAIQALSGGSFRDGFTQGIVQGLSLELTRYLNAEINAGVAHEQITPAQATALRELSNFTGTALRAAANPNDPMYAFAQDYLGQLFGPPDAATVAGSGNKPVDAETQQQIIWMQDAIDLGYTDTAATHFNNILERRAAANPTVSRIDIANQLIRELGIKPDTLGFVVGANGRVVTVDILRIVENGNRNDDDSDEVRYERRIRNAVERFRTIDSTASEQTLRSYAERAVLYEDDVRGLGRMRTDLTDNEARQIALGLQTDRERIRAYADRLNAIPEDQKPFELELVRSEFAGSELMQRFAQLMGPVAPLVGSEPMTRQQQLRLLDVVLGAAPVTGEATSIYEFIYGKSPASQEEASRVWAAVGILSAGYGRVGGRLLTAEQRVARELEYAGGASGTWNRKPLGISTDASTVLRTSLGPPPAGMINPEAHHLVGFGQADVRTQQTMNQFGITPNSVENGVWLSAEQHAMTLGNDYKVWVAGQLRDITSRADAIAALDRIKDTLRNLKPGITPSWRTGK